MREGSTGSDLAVAAARRAAIGALAPDARIRSIRWSGGTTEAIELGAGAPILLIHGGAGEAGHWLPLMPLLASEHRVIAVDAPGHGAADPYAYRDDLYELGARFIGDVLTTLEIDRAIVGGNSMGGLFAVGFALARPERVSHLLLIGSPAGTARRAPMPLRLLRWPWTRPLAARFMRDRDISRVRTRLGRLLMAHPERLPDVLVASFAATTARNIGSITRFVSRAIGLRGDLRKDVSLESRWTGLRVPVTFIWGERDRGDDVASGERIVTGMTRARLIRIADAGHQPALDEPAAVAAAIRDALRTTERPSGEARSRSASLSIS